MAEKITSTLYGGEVSIDFFPVAHRYKLTGSKDWVTSVTAITGIIDKSQVLIHWALNLAKNHVLDSLEDMDAISTDAVRSLIAEAIKKHQEVKDTACTNGSMVHAWAEAYARAKMHGEAMPKIGEDLPDQVIAGINAFLDWVNEHKVQFIATERMVYSKKRNYVGTVDAIALIDGKRVLIDYKTSKAVYNEMRYQVAGYRLALEEEGEQIDGLAIVHFSKETGEFGVYPIDEEGYAKDAEAFLGCLAVQRRQKELTKESKI